MSTRVMVMDEWPSHSCTTFAGNSRAPFSLGLMHHDAKVPQRVESHILGLQNRPTVLVGLGLAVIARTTTSLRRRPAPATVRA